ncbi:uncharacterized protein [Halyomorpha halys]|uniref:uncharacterized protein n=1 Tax=Halyomorpha halys TaxID=286706 RepID=UPI0006D4D013|nr:uncharacterized protein LOC106684920 [Halyomorpha halys]
MFEIILRRLPSTLRVLGGSVRCLSQRPTQTTPYFTPTVVSPRFTPIFTDPTLVTNNKSILDIPFISKNMIDFPIKIIPLEDKAPLTVVEEPDKIIKKEAARLIVIRRSKMKRHKLKKLRIKMKFIWAKVRQRREMKKEKAFQAELMCKIKEAENFDARQYVREKLDKTNAVLLPKLWRGKRLPEFVIKDLLLKKQRKEAQRLQDLERRKKMNLDPSAYKF